VIIELIVIWLAWFGSKYYSSCLHFIGGAMILAISTCGWGGGGKCVLMYGFLSSLSFSLFFLDTVSYAHTRLSSILVVLTHSWSYMVMMASINIISQ
jgi:hypothetical protein